MATVRKFVFFDPATGQYKEQTGNDTIQVANGVAELDAVNKGQLDTVASDAAAAVAAEEARALAAEAALQTAIDGVASDLSDEIARATAAEGVIAADLATEVTARESAVTALNTALSADILAEQTRAQAAEAGLAQDILDEQTRAEGVEASLQTQITAEVAARESAITNLNSTLSAAITAEESARIAADGVLQDNIDAEEAARIAADSALQTALDGEVARATAAEGVLTSDLATEVSDREAAVSAEALARQNADDSLSADIAAEETRAMGAEAALQAEIDAEEVARAAAITAEEQARIAGDAATLASANAYTDAVAQGLSVKQAVRFALPVSFEMGGNTINLPADFNSIASMLAANIGVGDRVLLIQADNEASAIDAGIYAVAGSAGAWTLARAADMAAGSDASGAFIYVEEGVMASSIPAESSGTGMVCANVKGDDTVGTDALTFSVFSRAEALTFSGGVEKTGLDVSLKFAENAPFTQGSGLALEIDGDYFNSDAGILTMQGVLVDGPLNIADAKHGHSRTSEVRAATGASEAHFAKYDGNSATWDSASCLAFVEAKNGTDGLLVLSGKGAHSALSTALSAFSVGDTVYLGGSGGEFSDFASVPSGKWAVPVGKKAASNALNVSIGVPLLKA